jgi:DNA (cytosine-5)-methyltransferase 1
MKQPLRVLDLFAGVGGFSLGMERAGFRTVGFVERDAFCNRVLARHWPGVPRWADITKVSGAELPVAEVVTGGWPCQDVSVAGRRAGLAGARSGLFHEMTRIVKEMRDATDGRYPTFVVGENVPGLLNSHRGRDAAAVLHGLAECGCLEVAWRICDARHWGVPQRRRRVFFVGDTRAAAGRPEQVLVEQSGVLRHSQESGEAGAGLAGSLTGGTDRRGWRIGADEAAARQPVAVPDVAYALNTSAERFDGTVETFVASQETAPPLMVEGFDASEDGQGRKAFAFALRAMGHDQSHANGGGQLAIAFYNNEGSRGSGNNAELAPPLKVANSGTDPAGRHGPSVAVAVTSGPKMWDDRGIHRGTVSSEVTPTLNGYEQPMVLPAVRRLTPTECARLQGFPDDWNCLCGVQPYSTWACTCPDGPRYASYGNAVCVPVIEWLGRRLLAALTCAI